MEPGRGGSHRPRCGSAERPTIGTGGAGHAGRRAGVGNHAGERLPVVGGELPSTLAYPERRHSELAALSMRALPATPSIFLSNSTQ